MTQPFLWAANAQQCFSWTNFSQYSTKTPPSTTWGYFFLSGCWLPGSSGWPLLGYNLLSVGRKERHPSDSFSPEQTLPAPSALHITPMLQTLHQPCCPSLKSLQHLNVLLVGRGTEPGTEPSTGLWVGLTNTKYREKITALVLLATPVLIQRLTHRF